MKKKPTVELTSVAAGFGAALCCVGPYALVVLGLGTTAGAVGAFFAPLRPWFLTLAFGLIGWRLFVVYRPLKERSPSGENATGSCPPNSRRRERTITWVAFVAVLILAVSPYIVAWLPAPLADSSPSSLSSASTETDGQEVCLLIDGMTCYSCAVHIEKSLSTIPGVHSATVDYDGKTACLFSSPDHPAIAEEAIKVVAANGYTARITEAK